jgi:hypothetical protein
MQQGLIYDPTAVSRIDDFLSTQEEEFKKQDKSSQIQKEKVIRFGIILGITVISILVLKVIVKKKK